MDDSRIKRFSKFRIAEHWIFTLAFLILVTTGLSQKFYPLDISLWVIFKLGGIDNVRLIHRYAGILFLAVTAWHVMTAMLFIVSKKWLASMIVTGKDFSDVIQNIKYYIGMRSRPALFDRYNYRQKFEYWGVLISAFIMIGTGLILWSPAFFTHYLPGEIIPAAQVMHTNHGLLILLIIALWHVYNSIFSPEIFPVDTSMFTSYISRERMVREHPVELARIERKAVDEVLDEYRDMENRQISDIN